MPDEPDHEPRVPHAPANRVVNGASVRRMLWVLGLVVAAWVLVELAALLLLVFAAVLIGLAFHALAGQITRFTRLRHRWALSIAIVVVALVLGLSGWLFGARVAAQFGDLQESLPRAWSAVEAWLGSNALGQRLLDAARGWTPSGSGVARNVGNAAVATVGAIGALVLVVFVSIYLAARPQVYVDALLQLLPTRSRDKTVETLDAVGEALRAWLGAQVMAMVVVGVLTSLGLWLIGVPSAIALGLLAALAEFVPIIGSIVAAIPAILLAMTLGMDTMLWTLALYAVVQQFEGNVLMPMVTRRAVPLAPAMAIVLVVAFGMLFGPLGALLGAPLSIVLVVLVRKLYLERRADGEAANADGVTR